MRMERREKVIAALRAAGWSLQGQGGGELRGTHAAQPALKLGIGPGGGLRWRGRHTPTTARPRAGDAPGIAEAIEATRVYDENVNANEETTSRRPTKS